MKKLSLLISLTIASSCCATRWHDAAETGNLERLQQLIQEEPQNINRTIHGNTPLHWAARAPHGNPQKALDTIKTLVKFYQNLPLDNN